MNLSLGLDVDVLDTAVAVTSDLKLALLDVTLVPIEARLALDRLPGRNTGIENIVHLFESPALGFGRGEEHVNECNGVEGAEDHVHLPVDGP